VSTRVNGRFKLETWQVSLLKIDFTVVLVLAEER